MSWWSLGEGVGLRGNSLELWRIRCPFFDEKGNFSQAHHEEKVKANADKKLNFDTLKCQNCAGFVMVLWSASEGFGGPLYDYKVLPWPLKVRDAPEEWPPDVGRYWLQARRNLADENWDAVVLMARSAMQLAGRAHGAKGANLKEEIESLAEAGKLPSIMKEWAHEVREIGNEAAHPRPLGSETQPRDARDIARFLDEFLNYLYTLPARINEYRKRREEAGGDAEPGESSGP